MTARQTLIEIKNIVESNSERYTVPEVAAEEDEEFSPGMYFNHAEDAYECGVDDGKVASARAIMALIKKFENEST